jgi:GT2 family glycosyltransferase
MKLTAGILTFNDATYIFRCLETLVVQEGLGKLNRDWQIVIHDNASPDSAYLDDIEMQFPQVILVRGKENLGFGKGHNKIMSAFPAEFHAVLNNDVLFNPDFLRKLLKALEDNSRFGSSTGKLLYWDFGGHPEKTNIIDSCGLEMTKSHAFIDRGQGKKDTAFTPPNGRSSEQAPNGFNTPGVCFGGSGAAVVYRRTALETVGYERRSRDSSFDKLRTGSVPAAEEQDNVHPEFFDERMFMYKEDVDLAYRLVSQGHFCLFVPDAVGWHNRTTSVPRRKRSMREKIGSAAHESFILKKHQKQWSFGARCRTLLRQSCKWAYLFIFETKVFFGARKLLRDIST